LLKSVSNAHCYDESSGNELIADPHLLPTSAISYDDGVSIFIQPSNFCFSLPFPSLQQYSLNTFT